jgi:starch synthase
VINFLGPGISKKSGFIHNCCEWDEEKIIQNVRKEHSQRMDKFGVAGSTRYDFRRYLLTKALGEIATPVVTESAVREIIQSLPRREMQSFSDDGPLVLTTGRLDRQKGVDILLKAVSEILEVLPSTKFLFLLVPLPTRELIYSTIQEAAEHEKNVRVVLGRTPEIYTLAHISADAYAMPSRWEPFGITALEAMATGNPVVGSRVGGIPETVLDILDDPQEGTGLLVSSEDHHELARGLICFLAMMKIDENVRAGRPQDIQRFLDIIPFDKIRELVARDPSVGSIIRKNCRIRVERRFRPKNITHMAIRAYEQASIISDDRNKLVLGRS